MSDQSLINRYRPIDWGEVIGHAPQLKALQRAMNSGSRPHAYLFTGPSGVGKTTCARILGRALEADILEIDAASNNGIDSMRELVEFSQHTSFVGEGRRLMLIDECHMLSRPAWNAILKLLEEPPNHCFIALCTTEHGKVPETINTRCYHTSLRPLALREMEDLVSVISELEGYHVQTDVFALIMQAASGSPRKALSILQAVHDVESRDEAKRVISLVEASDPMIELLQHLISGKRSWKQIRAGLVKIENETFEEASILAGRYIAGALLACEEDSKAQKIWQILDAMVFPSETYDKKIAFIAAIGRVMWGA
jgi:DNA polymerase-3 subunit gamma/tau